MTGGRYVRGEVVGLPFPFSDLSNSKRRPALVLSTLDGEDVILCMITSQRARDRFAVSIDVNDFLQGGLSRHSYVRPTRLFTADSRTILRSAGRISQERISQVIQTIIDILARQ